MIMPLHPAHFRRYKDVLRLLLKYGRSDLLKGADFELGDDYRPPPSASGPTAEELAADLEALGPTFVKLGQLLSTRTDFLPPMTTEALSRLRDKVEPVDGAIVLQTIEEDLGVKVSRLFPEFDLVPLGAASLGQVHRARLRDGREVVVKVQRPDVRRQALEDLEALAEIAKLLDRHAASFRRYRVKNMIEEFRRSLLEELDYRQEAGHLVTLRENLKEFDRIIVPGPVPDLTTSRVLTMEFVEGWKIGDLPPLDRSLLDREELADQLLRAYLKQILADGFVHADPHPGNVIVTKDSRLALLDLGMIARLMPRLQDRLATLTLAIAEGRGDEAAAAVLELAESDENADREAFRRQMSDIVGRFQGASLRDLEIGRVLVQISRAAVDAGFYLPPEIGMIGQTLLKLDSVGRLLSPEFKTNEAIRKHALRVMRSRVIGGESVGSLFRHVVELKEFATHLPGRVNRILDVIAENKLKLDVRAIDEARLLEGLQKIANRITLGLVLAALIIGAALLSRVESPFRLFGYPALPMILFAGAAVGILALVFTIVFKDASASDIRAEQQAKKHGRGAA